MKISEEIAKIKTIFIDTAPIIYYVEAHPQFGPITREVVNAFQSGVLNAFTSVISLVEVLPKPVYEGKESIARKFAKFLRYGKGLILVEISADIAETAGRLRGRYDFLKTMDALQISAVLDVGADSFLTNDIKLKDINELNIILLKEYL